MSGAGEALHAHLASGATTVCRAWAVRRADGVTYGFTDHDGDLAFEGITFRAGTGMTARALQQSTGLSVDNSEALGALSDVAVTEEDLAAGRFDGAEVRVWMVNWADPAQRLLQFRGSFGEIQRAGGAFKAELRGLTEALNQPYGRAYQSSCSAVLGDGACQFDLTTPGYSFEAAIASVDSGTTFAVGPVPPAVARWFERGRLVVVSGIASGLVGVIKADRGEGDARRFELWQGLGQCPVPGDLVRLEAGCDRRAETCRLKFGNLLNFRGFPHIPGEDWLASYPVSSRVNDGGSLQR